MIKQVNSNNFKEEVINTDQNVIVDFYADWCGPCKMLLPVLTNISEEYSNQVKLVRLNIDESPDISTEYRILSIPTLLFFKNGKMVGKSEGAVPKNFIEQKMNRYFN